MIKLGVTDRRGLARPTTLLGRRRHVSLLLLEDLASAEDVSPQLYDSLVGLMPMPSGVWKLTWRGRMATLDAMVLDLLRDRFGRGTALSVNDVAASTGITSVEFLRALKAAFTVELVASDLYRDVIAVEGPGRPRLAVVFDERGRAVQYVWGRLVLPAGIDESAAYPVNRLLRRWIRRRVEPRARAALARTDVGSLAAFGPVETDGHRVVRLPMLAYEALRAIRDDPGFRFEIWDVLQPLPRRAHVVRAMNILTADHLAASERERALRHCVEAVLPGGLFVVGWNPMASPDAVRASVYEVQGDRLSLLAVLNGGSDVDDDVARLYHVVDALESRAIARGTR